MSTDGHTVLQILNDLLRCVYEWPHFLNEAGRVGRPGVRNGGGPTILASGFYPADAPLFSFLTERSGWLQVRSGCGLDTTLGAVCPFFNYSLRVKEICGEVGTVGG